MDIFGVLLVIVCLIGMGHSLYMLIELFKKALK